MRFAWLAGFLLMTTRVHAEGPPGQEDPPTEEEDSFSLPPVPVDEMRATAPQPSWDSAFLYSVCGVGTDRPWQKTKFCLGGLADVLWGRRAETEAGFGAYGQLSTAGFRDFRLSLGPSGIVSLIEWFTLGLRGGGLLAVNGDGIAPGFEGYAELGHRSVSHRARYSVSHALFGGMQYNLSSGDIPAASVIWVGLRVDGMWITAPAALFK